MPLKIYHRSDLLLLIGLSYFGLFLSVILLVPSSVSQDLLLRKHIIGSIFGFICIFGIIAVFFPKKCSQIFYFKKKGSSEFFSEEGMFPFNNASFIFNTKITHGHHPICDNFSAHEFQIGNKTFCTGCTGLFFGALINLFGTTLYFSNNWQITQVSLFSICIGILGIAFGLLFPLFNFRGTILRLFFNAFFIFGMFSLLIGVDTFGNNFFFDLFLISLSIFWLFTRISLSQWNHRRICQDCGIQCKFSRDTRS